MGDETGRQNMEEGAGASLIPASHTPAAGPEEPCLLRRRMLELQILEVISDR